jgi:hypothetical protein
MPATLRTLRSNTGETSYMHYLIMYIGFPLQPMSKFVRFKTLMTAMPLMLGAPPAYRFAICMHLVDPVLVIFLPRYDYVHKINATCITLNALWMLIKPVQLVDLYVWSFLKTCSILLLYSMPLYDEDNLNEYSIIPLLQTQIHASWKYLIVLFFVEVICQRIVIQRRAQLGFAMLSVLVTVRRFI